MAAAANPQGKTAQICGRHGKLFQKPKDPCAAPVEYKIIIVEKGTGYKAEGGNDRNINENVKFAERKETTCNCPVLWICRKHREKNNENT